MAKRKTVIEFNGGELTTEGVDAYQLKSNDEIITGLAEINKSMAEYFEHCVGACTYPQRYKNSDVKKLLLSMKDEVAMINNSKNPFGIEAAYRLEELHEEMNRPRVYFKLEEKKTPMGKD